MEQTSVMSVLLFGLLSVALARPQLEERWFFPDEVDFLTRRPDQLETEKLWNEVISRRPNRLDRPSSTTSMTTSTTPSPDVIFQIPNCQCPFPPQYNPVCGTDGLSYVNAQFLSCAQRCGTDVRVARIGACKVRFSVDW